MEINKIAFVYCPVYDPYTPPVGIAYLSSYLRSKGYQTKVFDFNIELYNKAVDKTWWTGYRPSDLQNSNKIKDFEFFSDYHFIRLAKHILKYKAQVVCFSIFLTSELFSIELATKIKELDSKCVIIFGGPAFPLGIYAYLQNILPSKKSADVLIIGEGEKSLYKAVKNFLKMKKNKGIKVVTGEIVEDIDGLPIPDYKEFDLRAYKSSKDGFIPLVGSRGCPNNCVFCYEKPYWKKYRSRSHESIVKEFELRKKQGFSKIIFCDSTINGDMNKLNLLCKELIRREMNMPWTSNANIKSDMTYKFLKQMRKAGCFRLHYGAESASKKILKLMNKGTSPFEMSKIIIKTRLAGIKVTTNWIIGFPNENWFDFFQTLFFLIIHRPFINALSFNLCFTPLNTKLGKEPNSFGIKINKERTTQHWESVYKKNNFALREKKMNIALIISLFLGYFHISLNVNNPLIQILKNFKKKVSQMNRFTITSESH